MAKRTSFLRIFTERGPLAVLAVAGVMLFGIVGPASAQFFNFFDRRPPPSPPRGIPGGPPSGYYPPFGDLFPGAPPPNAQPRPVDSSRAPPPAKREVAAERNVLVLGDAMADWLAYGLEDALLETPELGVIRKHKTVSGLIRYQPKGEPVDWVAAAKTILATEKPDVIVVMLGLNDRMPIREPVVEKKADAKPGDKPAADKTPAAKKDARAKADTGKPQNPPSEAVKPDDEAASAAPSEAKPADDAADDDDDQPAIAAPEKTTRSASGSYEFRDERWVELYSKKIEEMIAVLKTKGVPVLWVGLPSVRGPKATSDMLFLDALYRDAAGKANITYVDVWDGFVDEAGRFVQQGPDFEGQIRRLRSSDGVYFTKAGARKLAHYTEREIRRVLASRTAPITVPADPEASVRPGVTGPRPLAGPIVPLVASSVGTDELLGGNGTRPASVDALAARTLVKGEALAAPAGRADDFAWPRREVGALAAPATEPDVASAPDATNPASLRPRRKPPQQLNLSGFDQTPSSQQSQPAAPRARSAPPRDNFPRPPANVGPAAFFPSFFSRW